MSITPAPAPVLAATLAAALLATPLAAQDAADSGTFTLTQGGTVMATETFARTGQGLETELEVVGQARMTTAATLGEDGTVARVEIRVYPPGQEAAEPLQTSAAEFRDGMLHLEQPIGTQAAEPTEVEAGVVPYLNPSPAYMEQILRRARALGGDSATVQVWVPGPGAGQVVPAQVAFAGAAATLGLGAVEVQVETDADGRLLSASVPAQGLEITRE